MRPIIEAACAVDRFVESRGWRGCIIGGVAGLRWGEVRFTKDVDATIYTGFADDEAYITALLAQFPPRIGDAAAFALANRVVLATAPHGVPLDIALGGLPFEEGVVQRATRVELAPGLFVRTASAEDLIVMKAFAARPRDWLDISGIIVRQGRRLDWTAIHERLGPLVELKEAPEILARLDEVRRAAEQGS